MKLLVVILAFFYNVSFACTNIVVSGTGKNAEEATHNALQTAINVIVGQVIVSERETANLQVKRESILNYSSGYINNYKIVKSGYNSVTLEACVESSKIANRILGKNNDYATYDSQPVIKYETFLDSKQKGDLLLSQLLDDYPSKAYNLNTGKYRVSHDMYRNMYLEIPFKINWNYNYIVSLNEVAGLISDGSNGLFTKSPGNLVVMAKDPNDFLIGKKTKHQFNDVIATNKIRQTLANNPPRIALYIYDTNNQPIYQHCYIPDSVAGNHPPMYSVGETLIVYGNQVENNIIRVSFDNMMHVLRSMNRIEMRVAGNETCS